jgi:hypothetical protein
MIPKNPRPAKIVRLEVGPRAGSVFWIYEYAELDPDQDQKEIFTVQQH